MAMVECAWCRGKGIDNGKLGSPCDVCGGDGYISVPDPPTKCGRCSGSGRTKSSISNEMVRCSGCNGSGWAN